MTLQVEESTISKMMPVRIKEAREANVKQMADGAYERACLGRPKGDQLKPTRFVAKGSLA
jgi:hypothetical protein